MLLAVLTVGCSAATGAEVQIGDRKVAITTTTTFITDAAVRVGGDRVEVTALMGPGVDPHLYRASAGDVQSLREADLVIYGGLNLEGKMADLLADIADRRPTLAITDAIAREDLLPAPGTDPADQQYDPHVWFDVALWRMAVSSVTDTLIELDPAHADTYRANSEEYLNELDALDSEVRDRIASIPAEHRLLVTSHDAFEYFGRRYGMEVAAIQGISTAAEATTADVERVATLLAERQVPAVFVETSVPRQTIDALLAATAERGHDAVIGAELFADAGGSAGTPEATYPGMVRANSIRIATALGGTP